MAYIGSNHTIEIKDATDALRKQFAQLPTAIFENAVVKSINFTLSQSNRILSSSVRKIFNIDGDTFSKAIKIKKANRTYQYGYILAKSRALNLANFSNTMQVKAGKKTSFIGARKGKNRGAYGTSPTPVNTQGIFVEIYNGQQELIPSAFLMMARSKNSSGQLQATGNAFVAARGTRTSGKFVFSKENKPISAMTSKSIYTALINPSVQGITTPPMTDIYSKKLMRELTVAVKGIK